MRFPFPKSPLVKFVLLLFLISLALSFLPVGKMLSFDGAACKKFLSQFPPGVSETLFIVLYLFLPKDILRIPAAVIYGPYLSTVLVFIGEMLNLVIFFYLSRKLGRAFVERKLGAGMRQVDEVVANSGWGMIFLLRLFPIVAFRVLDLGFGLTRISFGKYFLISLLASPPRIFLVQLVWSLGAATVLDPNRFAEYLNAHPQIAGVLFAYVLGSIMMLFVIKRMASGGQKSRIQNQI